MKITEITNTLKTYRASVKLNNGSWLMAHGSWLKTSVQAENLSQAMQLLKHLFINLSSVSELAEQVDELDEATAMKTTVKS